MAEGSNTPDGGSRQLSPPIIRTQLDRVLGSQAFAQAPMLRRLLQYLVEHTLDGQQRELKEYAVGVDVFDRGLDFDPRTDTIVRVQARRLRAKLADYYRGEGAADPVIVEVPKGHYVVACRRASPVRDPTTVHVSREPTPSFAGASDVAGRATGAGQPAIVVLPFANLSGDAENEYLTDGLTEEIISALASVPELRVVARTSAFQFKGRCDDIRKIGRELGVQTALEGSVRKDGQRIRVTAQLINVVDGFHLWSHVYEAELPGVFTLQQDTTHSIVAALRIRLTAGEQERLRPLEPASLEAYELYLKGLYFFNKATPADFETSIGYLQHAVAIDGNYAAAHAGLAYAYVLSITGDQPAPQLLERARQAAERALELDDLAEAHGAMALVLAVADWDWLEAEREFRRALELKPSLAVVRIAYAAGCLCPMRRYEDAIHQMRLARMVDPVSALARTISGQTFALAGRPAEALDELRQALELEPDFASARCTLAFTHLITHSYAEAVAALEPIQHLAAQYPNCAGNLGYAHSRMGHRAEAERLLQLLLDRFPGAWAPWIDVAAIYNGLGETTKAIEWLERGYQQRCFDSLFLSEDPRFVNLHSNSRFKQLVEKVSMVRTVPDAVT